MNLVDPEAFGCASKLSYRETSALAALNPDMGPRDYGVGSFSGMFAASVDRVYMCAEDPKIFASIALNHAINDTNVSLAIPRHVMIAFEFDEKTTVLSRSHIAEAFCCEVARRSLNLGKCHSSISTGRTSVTIAVIASDPVGARSLASDGIIVMSRPLGFFKLHYLAESPDSLYGTCATSTLSEPFMPPPDASSFSDLCDVSGHGLAGAVRSLAIRNEIDIEVILDTKHAAHPDVISKPMPCFQNFIGDFVGPGVCIDEPAWPLAGLMETAGPILGLLNHSEALPADPFGTGQVLSIGNYRQGTGQVVIRWQD